MKNSIKKIVAGISAAAMLVSAMPIVSAFAADEESVDFNTRSVDGGVVITEYTGKSAEKIVIPAKIGDDAVVGIDDFAFSLISQDVTFVVPSSLKYDEMGNNAFTTAGAFNKGVISASGQTTVKGVVNYWTNLLGVSVSDMVINKVMAGIAENMTTVDFGDAINKADPAEANAALNEEMEKAVTQVVVAALDEALSTGTSYLYKIELKGTLTETAIGFVQDVQAGKFNVSAGKIAKLNIALAALPYPGVTLEGPADAEIATYAKDKNIEYVAASSRLMGDVDDNGRIDLYDAIGIARHLVKNPELAPEDLAYADYDGDSEVGLYDIINISKSLLS